MKKIFLLTTIIPLTLLFGGEINEKFKKINENKNIEERIEAKLDIIIGEYIKNEQYQEARKQVFGNTIEKSIKNIANNHVNKDESNTMFEIEDIEIEDIEIIK